MLGTKKCSGRHLEHQQLGKFAKDFRLDDQPRRWSRLFESSIPISLFLSSSFVARKWTKEARSQPEEPINHPSLKDGRQMAAPPPKRRKEGRKEGFPRSNTAKNPASSRFDIVSSSVLASPVESDSGCVILRQHIAREHIPPHPTPPVYPAVPCQ